MYTLFAVFAQLCLNFLCQSQWKESNAYRRSLKAQMPIWANAAMRKNTNEYPRKGAIPERGYLFYIALKLFKKFAASRGKSRIIGAVFSD